MKINLEFDTNDGAVSFLKKLDEGLVRDRFHGKFDEDLWTLLTALRGPDDEDGELKRKTTAFVRAATLPALAQYNCASVYYVGSGWRVAHTLMIGDHFSEHVRRALGLVGFPYIRKWGSNQWTRSTEDDVE